MNSCKVRNFKFSGGFLKFYEDCKEIFSFEDVSISFELYCIGINTTDEWIDLQKTVFGKYIGRRPSKLNIIRPH